MELAPALSPPPRDKIQHFALSAVTAAAANYTVRTRAGLDAQESLAAGVSLTLGLGVLKEWYDVKKKNPTGFSWSDLLADLAGVLAAAPVMYLQAHTR